MRRLLVEELENRLVPSSASLGWATAVTTPTPGSSSGATVATDALGNDYATGTFQGTATFGSKTLTSSANGDGYVAKLNSSGNYLWAVDVATDIFVGSFSGIAVDIAGNPYVAIGYKVSKLNGTDGSVAWTDSLPYNALRVAVDGSGNAYVLGTSSAVPNNLIVSMFSSTGALQWTDQIGSAKGVTWLYGGIAVNAAGVYITGEFDGKSVDFNPGPGAYTLSSSGDGAAYVLNLTNTGGFGWAEAFQPSSRTGTAWGRSIAVDGAGNVYTSGLFWGSVNFNPAPKGTAYTLTSGSTESAYVAKLNANGGLTWAKAFGGNTARATSLAVDSSGNVYVTGSFQGTGSFGTTTLKSAGSWDIFAAKLDTNGNFQWAVSAGSTGADDGWGIAVDGSGNVYVSGSFNGTVDFDPGAGVYNLTASSNGSAFLWKLTQA